MRPAPSLPPAAPPGRPARLGRAAAALALALGAASCAEYTTGNGDAEREVRAVLLGQNALTLAEGDTVRLRPTLLDQKGAPFAGAEVPAGTQLEWSVSDPSVADVAVTGTEALVTAKDAGAVQVRATLVRVVGRPTVAASVEVRPAVGGLQRDGDDVTPDAEAGAALGAPVRARVVDRKGRPMAGALVRFAVRAGGGHVSPDTARSDASGLAATTWTLGPTAGAQQMAAGLDAMPGAEVLYAARAVAGAPARLEVMSGQGQTARYGAALAAPLVVRVTDRFQNPVAGATVAWRAGEGQGTLTPAEATTDAAGRASARWTLGDQIGPAAATASVPAAPAAGTAAFDAEALAGGAARVRVAPRTLAFGALGRTRTLAAEAFDAAGNVVPNPTLAWRSTAEAVASVDASGQVQARGTGAADVIVTHGAGAGAPADTVRVTVQQVPASVAITGALARLEVGQTRQFAAAVRDSGGAPIAGAAVAWSSRDEGAATVGADGLVTARGEGTARIVAASGQASAEVSFLVGNAVGEPARVLVVRGDAQRVPVATTAPDSLVVRVVDINDRPVPGVAVRWTVGPDEGGASEVSPEQSTTDAQGLAATARSVGGGTIAYVTRATVTRANGATAEAQFVTTGVPGAPTELRIFDAAGDTLLWLWSADAGASRRVVAKLFDRYGHHVLGPAVTWSTADGRVATVDPEAPAGGVTPARVAAVGAGNTEVTARYGALSAALQVYVNDPQALACGMRGGTVHEPMVQEQAETWTRAGSPHRVRGRYAFAGSFASLTIEPGALVCAETADAELVFQGGAYLNAIGEPGRAIVFRPDDEASGWWAGIHLRGTANLRTRIAEARVVGARNGIRAHDRHRTELTGVFVERTGREGVELLAVDSKITGGLIRDAGAQAAAWEEVAALTLGHRTTAEDIHVLDARHVGVSLRGANITLLGGTIEGSGSYGLETGLVLGDACGECSAYGSVATYSPVFIRGGRGYPAKLVADAMGFLGTPEHAAAWTGNARDTIEVFRGTLAGGSRVGRAVPWRVLGQVGVTSRLEIEPGARLTMEGSFVVRAGGEVVAEGTRERPIVIAGRGAAGGFDNRLDFGDGGAGTFRHVLIDGLGAGVQAFGGTVAMDSVTLRGMRTAVYAYTPGIQILRSVVDGSTDPSLAALKIKSGVVLTDVVVRNAAGIGVEIVGGGNRLTRVHVVGSGSHGVRVDSREGGSQSDNVITGGSFVNNGGNGVQNDAFSEVDARGNWWGHRDGPAAAGGDGVSARVNFSAWLEQAPATMAVLVAPARTLTVVPARPALATTRAARRAPTPPGRRAPADGAAPRAAADRPARRRRGWWRAWWRRDRRARR